MDSNDDKQQISALLEGGDRALISGDPDDLSRIYADDYVQYDEAGKAFTRQAVIDNLQTGKIRYVSMVSTSRQIRLFGDFAIVHGSEVNIIDREGQRVTVRYMYMDVVVKRSGRWQIVGSQLAKGLESQSESIER